MKARVLPLLVGFVVFVSVSKSPIVAQQTCGSSCDVRGNPPPPSLQDDGGHGSDYKFHHLSDAGGVTNPDTSKIRRYRYLVQNLHRDRVLDAEWTDVGVIFQSISPGCCALLTRESCKQPVEDTKAEIKYGAAKTFTDPASAYLPATVASASEVHADRPGHQLRSKISGTFTWNKERLPVEVEFTATANSDGIYSYTIGSSGPTDLLFEMPALTAVGSKSAKISSEWVRYGATPELFKLQRGKSSTMSIKVVNPGQMVEDASSLTIFAPDGKTVLAHVIASVWRPRSEW